MDHNFFAVLRLGEKKKEKNKSRKVGKAQRQSASAESHIERTTISLRLCVFARRKKTYSPDSKTRYRVNS
jgi:hypothetical protein